MSLSLEQRIRVFIEQHCAPLHYELVNESHMHSVPGTETHFKVLVVSEKFQGLSRMERQQWFMSQLKEQFSKGLHALSMRLLTPEEHQKRQIKFSSPVCASAKVKN